jgi:hypothetical protein
MTPANSSRRTRLLARLAAERAFLLQQLEGLDEDILSRAPVVAGWTAAGLLAHLGYWDAFTTDRLSKLMDGRRGEIHPLDENSLDARNAVIGSQFSKLSFPEAIAICQKERRNFLMMLDRIPDETLHRRVRLGPEWRVTPHTWVRRRYRHDAAHATDLAGWRKTQPPNDPSLRAIHRSLLRPILGLSRREFLALAALMPPRDRERRLPGGTWSLKQIVGHLSDYERLGVVALKAVAAGREPVYKTPIPDFELYNAERGAAWAAESWDEAWAYFVATRRALLQLAEALPQDVLTQPFSAPWPATTTACGYLLDMAQHEQEHADALRRAFGYPPLPRRLDRM